MAAKNLYKLFIDTGAFIALINEDDSLHKEAAAFYKSLKKDTILTTSLLVVSETYTWLRYHIGHNIASKFLSITNKAVQNNSLFIIYPDADLDSKTRSVLQNYQDQDLSYIDALSFAIIETNNIKDVFGFDSHFYIININLWPAVKKT